MPSEGIAGSERWRHREKVIWGSQGSVVGVADVQC